MGESIKTTASAASEGTARVMESGTQLLERTQQVREDAGVFADAVQGALGEATTYVREHLEQRPYATLAAAAGVGFVLGGGLTLRMMSVLFRLGGRFAIGALAQGYLSRGSSVVAGEGEPGPLTSM